MLFVLIFIVHSSWAMNLLELNEHCTTDFDCADRILHSICSNQRCICPDEYRFDGLARCIIGSDLSRFRRDISYGMKILGEDCQWTTQCRQSATDTNKVCVNYKCRCIQGYIAIDAFRCVRDFEPFPTQIRFTKSLSGEIPGFGSVCSTTSDCQQMTQDLLCLNNTCQCAQGYVPLGRYICYTIHAQDAENPIRTRTTATKITTRVTSVAPAILPAINSEVMRSLGKIGNPCINDYFCRRSVTQSHCYNGKCACLDGYIAVDQYTCLRDMKIYTTTPSTLPPVEYKSLLGGPCITKRNCHTHNAVCIESICSCPEDYFAVDDWSCLPEPESSDEESDDTTSIVPTTITSQATTTTISTIPTTTIFRWWPWSPTTTTRQPMFEIPNSFRARCLLNRQCASMDRNSHCTLFGRCICNRGYQLETTDRGQHCVRQLIDENDCD